MRGISGGMVGEKGNTGCLHVTLPRRVLSLLFAYIFLFFCMSVNLAFHEDNLLPLQQIFYEQFYIHTATMTMMISIAFFCSTIFHPSFLYS